MYYYAIVRNRETKEYDVIYVRSRTKKIAEEELKDQGWSVARVFSERNWEYHQSRPSEEFFEKYLLHYSEKTREVFRELVFGKVKVNV